MTTDRTREQWQRSNQRLHAEVEQLRAEVARLRALLLDVLQNAKGSNVTYPIELSVRLSQALNYGDRSTSASTFTSQAQVDAAYFPNLKEKP